MVEHPLATRIGNRVSLTGHFDVPVGVEDVRPLGANGSAGYECRVRLPDGALEEAVISPDMTTPVTVIQEDQTMGTTPERTTIPGTSRHPLIARAPEK